MSSNEEEMNMCIEPVKIMNKKNILDFSDEILCFIFSLLPCDTLAKSIPSTCKRFEQITKDEYMWQLICNNDCGIFKKVIEIDTWKETLFKNYCKHFLSIDYQRLRKTYTDEHKEKINKTLCYGIKGDCESSNKDGLWVCLVCDDYVGCSRYKNKHAMIHAKESGHAFNCKWDRLEFWCYHCMRYVGNKNEKEKEHAKILRKIISYGLNEGHVQIMSS